MLKGLGNITPQMYAIIVFWINVIFYTSFALSGVFYGRIYEGYLDLFHAVMFVLVVALALLGILLLSKPFQKRKYLVLAVFLVNSLSIVFIITFASSLRY